MSKLLRLLGYAVFALCITSCADVDERAYVNTYFYINYDLASLEVMCQAMVDGDIELLETVIGAELIKIDEDCQLRIVNPESQE